MTDDRSARAFGSRFLGTLLVIVGLIFAVGTCVAGSGAAGPMFWVGVAMLGGGAWIDHQRRL